MIRYIKGDLLSVTKGIIAHGCNCSGGFGSGVAGQIRAKYPEVYERFKQMPTGLDTVGKVQIVDATSDLIIANCFTQLNYGKDGYKYADAQAIRKSLRQLANWMDLTSGGCHPTDRETISMPKIGAGLGGLDWDTEVEPIIRELDVEFENIDFDIYYI